MPAPRGDAAKARRFSRGLATLNDQKKKVNAGKGVDLDDIPPPIAQSAVVLNDQPTASKPDLPVNPPLMPTPAPRSAPLPPVPLRSAPPPPPSVAPPTVTVTTPVQAQGIFKFF